MRLHDNPISSNALKVRFLLAELGLGYERVEVPLTRPRPEEYLALNPLGGIPTLVDGDLVLSESNAILRYLAAREGRDDLYAAEPGARARVDEFLDRFSLAFRPAFWRIEMVGLGFDGQRFDGKPRDPEGAREAAAAVADRLALFDSLVGTGGTVFGSFTIADCAVAPVLFRTRSTGLDLTPYPRLLELRETVCARPAFASAGPVL